VAKNETNGAAIGFEEQFAEGEKLTATVRKNLEGLAHGG
jgi:hypothetical protein